MSKLDFTFSVVVGAVAVDDVDVVFAIVASVVFSPAATSAAIYPLPLLHIVTVAASIAISVE